MLSTLQNYTLDLNEIRHRKSFPRMSMVRVILYSFPVENIVFKCETNKNHISRTFRMRKRRFIALLRKI